MDQSFNVLTVANTAAVGTQISAPVVRTNQIVSGDSDAGDVQMAIENELVICADSGAFQFQNGFTLNASSVAIDGPLQVCDIVCPNGDLLTSETP
jgi:hypothetical protein